mmetsp:Transcript_33471/g.48527  ORF Transcript_33471/g.48527 Transcript_33471/m.48527 type:complete len:432 (+) Transcript_33471:426-1721(+)
MKHSLEGIETGAWKRFQEYMKVGSAFLKFGLKAVIKEEFDSFFTDLFPFLVACLRSFPLRSHHSVLRDFFKSPKLQAMLSFQDLYVGLSPYETPAVFALLQALEYEQGIFYPRGGFGQVAQALKRAAEQAGVTILTNHTVHAINMSPSASGAPPSVQSLRVTAGVTNSSFEVDAAAVVVNVDAPQAEELFGGESTDGWRTSCGVLALHWGFNTTLSPLLQHHTLFLSTHYADSWVPVEATRPTHPQVCKIATRRDHMVLCLLWQHKESRFNEKAFNFYVHAPSRTDPSCCPAGSDAITVLVPVPPLRDSSDRISQYDEKEVIRIRAAVLSRMQAVCDQVGQKVTLKDHIVCESHRTPSDWQRDFNLFRGSAFGLTHNLQQLSLLRPRIRHPSYRGLYRVGASTRPGNGVPLVMIGAGLTASAVLRDLHDPK